MVSPKVSIVILTYNNPTILTRCIESVLALDYPDREIIVVDNASTDDTVKIVEAKFGDLVKLLARTTNSPVQARNEGFQAARGDFVLSLDHDMILKSPQVLQRGLQIFEAVPRAGLLAFEICSEQNPEEPLAEHWWYPTPMDEAKKRHFFTSYFSEGAAFFRSQSLRETGGYDENFFYFAENLDLAYRLVDLDWRILYCPSLSSIELVVSDHQSRQPTKGNYFSLRNRLWVAHKHLPLARAMVYAVPRIVVSGIRSIRYAWFKFFLGGLRDGLFAPIEIRRERKPLSSARFREMRDIEGASVELPVASRI